MQEIEKLVIYFTFYSVIGWICEVIYCSHLEKRFVNRGFLAGPVCPVYGFGALFVIWMLTPVPASIPIIFFSGLVITSIVEYITGWMLEVFFGTRWWDYRDQKFNLEGRVCLKNSICFGIMCVILIRVLHPFLVYLSGLVPAIWLGLLSGVLMVVLIVDSVIALNTVVNLNERLKKLHDFTEELRKNADIQEWFNEREFSKSFEKLKVIIEEGKNGLNQKLEESKNELYQKLRTRFEALTDRRVSEHRIIKAFPDMKSLRYDVQLNHLKDALKELKQKAIKK